MKDLVRISPLLRILGLLTITWFSTTACQESDGSVLPLAKSATMTITTKNILTDAAPVNVRVEEIDIEPADDESNIDEYVVYWAQSRGVRSPILISTPIAIFAANGNKHNYRFPEGAVSPTGVWGIVVCSVSGSNRYCGTNAVNARNSYPLMADLDLVNIVNSIFPKIDSLFDVALELGSCQGLGIVRSCGNDICESYENTATCPRDCEDFSIQSYNAMHLCLDTSDQLTFTVNSVEEIQQIINDARVAGQHVKAVSGAVPMENDQKVVGKIGGATSFACTDGIVISMDNVTPENPNFPIGIETFEGKEVVHVPAGMRLQDLGEWLHDRGRGLGYVHMGWADVSIGGNISTSAHGSSAKNRSVLAQSVVAMDIVGSDGVLRTYSEGTTDSDTFKALRTGIGYLGVIVNVKIEVQPTTNLHAKVTYHDAGELFDGSGDGWHSAIADCDWGQFIWYPGMNKWVKMCGMETSEPAEPGAQNRLLNPDVSQAFLTPFEQAFQAAACEPESEMINLLEIFRFTQLVLIPPLSKEVDGKIVASGDVIGPQYKMQSAQANLTTLDVNQLDYEIAIPYTYMEQAAVFTQSFMAGNNSKNQKIVLPLNGIFARFGIAEDNTLMAYTGTGGPWIDGEPVAYFEVTNYVPIGWSEQRTAEYLELTVEYVMTMIQNFNGRGHWTKNRDWIFPLEKQVGSLNYDGRFDRFNSVIGQLDPIGMFANPMAETMGISYPQFSYPPQWNE